MLCQYDTELLFIVAGASTCVGTLTIPVPAAPAGFQSVDVFFEARLDGRLETFAQVCLRGTVVDKRTSHPLTLFEV